MWIHGVNLPGRGAATKLFPVKLSERIETRADDVFIDELRLNRVPPYIVAASETLDDIRILRCNVVEFAAIGAKIE